MDAEALELLRQIAADTRAIREAVADTSKPRLTPEQAAEFAQFIGKRLQVRAHADFARLTQSR